MTYYMAKGVTWETEYPGCNPNDRRQTSIIVLWMYTNYIVAALSLPGVLIDFLLERRKDQQNMRQLIVQANRNTLKKFYADDTYVSDNELTSKLTTLGGRLEQRLLDRIKAKDGNSKPKEEEKSEEEMKAFKEFKQRERRAENLNRMNKE